MKNKELHNIKSTGFKTPDDYFDSVEEKIFSKLNTESVLDSVNTPGFKVPDNYFESLNERVLNKALSEEKPKVIPLFSKTNIIYVSSIAAAILLLFNLSIFDSKPTFDNLDIETVENYLEDESISTYEIAALFSDKQIDEDIIIDFNFNEDNIEEYLLNNADIETLILD
ncbi:hypothetical protein FPF71_15625 [Algibacter amylolyticus]|uniref:Uncharacterized protein n=1 Tax=Algibacter amylolyticus TaxID=1608400 RepID=A0A5M7B3Q7_9FLAO|nr:hypothetical protein [Algibacter amylolyticus]KAA5821935.1 hypothetical protein F2B50_15625 [Algibacter amylolyticus]MBB5269266.1 hypothetical protein [Algibacter amylolyticus]TSJ73219.1 hypothetical protein FPF71_15625 [Algibacter amylolyticus]